jgi:AcrR family transcriptional regulator
MDPRKRGPKPALSVDRIAEAAIALADAEGLAAVSMERVAAGFGFTPMALYRYVPGKAELVALMVERGIGQPPPLGGSWRERLAAWAAALGERWRAHPWSLDATDRLRPMGPNELAWLEAGLGALADTGLSPRQRQAACVAVLAQVRTAARFATAPDGLTGSAWEAAAASFAEGDGYPGLRAVLAEPPNEDTLGFGLRCVLDGIEAVIGRT